MWVGRSRYRSSTINGYIDEVRVYDRILSQNEIQKFYNGSGSRPGGPTGSAWVEESYLRFIDENGFERIPRVTDTDNNPSGASIGNMWMHGVEAHYVDVNGNERVIGDRSETHIFRTSDSYGITSGSPVIYSKAGTIDNLQSSGSGDTDNVVTLDYTDAKSTFKVQYEQTSSPPYENFEDRYHSIAEISRSDGYTLFDVNVVGGNEIYVYDPTDTNQDYNYKRNKN